MAIFPFELIPIFDILLFTIIVTFILNLLQKFLVNQTEAGEIREKMKEMNENMKELRKENKKNQANEILDEYLKENAKLMKMSIKPLAFSLIIILIVFTFANSAYETVINTSNTSEFQGLELIKENDSLKIGETDCSLPCTFALGEKEWHVNEKSDFLFSNPDNIIFSQVIVELPIGLPLIGNNAGWLVWYILNAIPISLVFRSLLRINV